MFAHLRLSSSWQRYLGMQRFGPSRRCVQAMMIGIFSRQICGGFINSSVRVQKLLPSDGALSLLSRCDAPAGAGPNSQRVAGIHTII